MRTWMAANLISMTNIDMEKCAKCENEAVGYGDGKLCQPHYVETEYRRRVEIVLSKVQGNMTLRGLLEAITPDEYFLPPFTSHHRDGSEFWSRCANSQSDKPELMYLLVTEQRGNMTKGRMAFLKGQEYHTAIAAALSAYQSLVAEGKLESGRVVIYA